MTVTTEPTTTVRRLVMLALALGVCLVTMLTAAGQSYAGTYTVRQCDYAQGIGHHEANYQWAGTIAVLGGNPSVVQHTGSGCGEFGLAARTNMGGHAFTHANGAYGGYFFYAPHGTYFLHFSGMFGTVDNCCVSGMAHYADATQDHLGGGARAYLFQGHLGNGTFDQPSGVAGPVGRGWNASSFWAKRVGFYLRCGPGFNCNQGPAGDQRVRGRSFEFALYDDAAPSVGSGGSLFSGGWIRGTRTLDFAAGDTGGGLAWVNARFDTGTILESPSSCSIVAGRYVSFTPCPLSRGGTWNVNTATLPDGPRSVTVYTGDVGGLGANQVRTFHVDNNAPAAPTAMSVAEGQGWRSTNSFSVNWQNPGGQHAPINAVHMELCPVTPVGACITGTQSGNGINSITGSVPAPGEYSLRTWLQDEAGNTNAGSKSDPVMLRFDNQGPGAAELSQNPAWMNGNEAQGLVQQIQLASGAFSPPAGVAGFSVTTDGTDPDGSIDAAGNPGSYTIADLPEGETTIKARAISGSGVPSGAVGSTVARVDKTPPSASAAGVPDPAVWSRSPALIQLAGVDQEHLSGMTGAPPEAPVSEGGHMVHRVDGAAAQHVRGGTAAVSVPGDGRHTLTYQAVDAAGNPSDEKTVQFKIDRTAPSGSFEYQDPADPRRLAVSAFDATSGVAGGQIQYRPEGAGAFRPIATTLTEGKFVARLDDVALPDGRYEFRALVNDVAGNQSSIGARADGKPMVLSLPLRITTLTRAVTGGGVKLSRCAVKAAKKRGAKRRRAMRRCKKRKVLVSPGKGAVSLGFGKRARTIGQVTTTAGIPIPNAYITVEAQLRSGGPFTRIGAARSDGQGVFRFMVPPGASRTIRFYYDGSNIIRPSAGQLTTRVAAALTFKVNRRNVRNGQRVVFKGRLRGTPFPSGGKLIVLKAKVPRVAKWKTFGTVRTNAKGRFRYPRRFTSTYGLVRYIFRAEAPREVNYSYERGISKTTRVAVRGPGG